MGKAIILANQDFSNSPLGTVTFIESEQEKAHRLSVAYCTAIGDDTYLSDIETMMFGIISNGLLDKIKGLYPILGSSASSLIVNAISPGVNNLTILANASAGENKLDFVRNIGVGDKTPSHTISVGDDIGILSYTQNKPSTGTSPYFSYYGSSYTHHIWLTTVLSSPNFLAKADIAGTSIQSSNDIALNPFKSLLGLKRSTGSYSCIFNNTDSHTGTISDLTKLEDIAVDTIVGANWYAVKDTAEGQTISNNTNLANGYMYFLAFGNLSVSELQVLGVITDVFLSSVKNLSFSNS